MASSSSLSPSFVKRARTESDEEGDKNEGTTTILALQSQQQQQHEEDKDDNTGSSTHPLMVDLVLQTIFDYCGFEDLTTCRSVCKLWYRLSFALWLKLLPTKTFKYERQFLEFMNMVHSDFKRYDEYEWNGLKKCSKYSLRHCVDLTNSLPLLSQFHIKCGPWLTALELKFTFPSVTVYEHMVLGIHTPNLKRLRVDLGFPKLMRFLKTDFEYNYGTHDKLHSLSVDIDTRSDYMVFPIKGWTQLFCRYPHIQTITHGGRESAMEDTIYGMFQAARNVMRKGSGLKMLKNLHVHSWRNRTLKSLSRFVSTMSLSLQELHIPAVGDNQIEQIQQLLSLQANSLHKLAISGTKPILDGFQTPADMLQTHLLVINGCPFRRLTFLNGFKSLETLTMKGWQYRCRDEFPLPILGDIEVGELEDNLLIPTLKTFHCEYTRKQAGVFCVKDILKLAKCMPNLKDLQLWLTNDTFKQVCASWPLLQRLEILGDDVDDDGLVGLQQPTITDLKELRVFSVQQLCEPSLRYYTISPKSINAGLLKMTNLHTVLFENLPRCSVDIQALKENVVIFHCDNFCDNAKSTFLDQLSSIRSVELLKLDITTNTYDVPY